MTSSLSPSLYVLSIEPIPFLKSHSTELLLPPRHRFQRPLRLHRILRLRGQSPASLHRRCGLHVRDRPLDARGYATGQSIAGRD